MERLSEALQPYKDEVGLTASIVTILQFFSGSLICRDIYNKRSTRDISALPFVGGLAIGILVLKYAILLQDPNMFNVNVAAILLNAIYLVFYSFYTLDLKKEVLLPASKGITLVVIILAYTLWESEDKLEYRYSLLITMLMLFLMGSPLMDLSDIIIKRDASCIPFPLTFMGFVTSLSWLIYGIILFNEFMIVQNTLGMILCLTQLILIAMYPKPIDSKKRN